ncbi:MAG: hypothetical protein MZV63_34235 [Marinilabiliales bacterium]|nr:hypothetical protein [Marinilabiliales bacterium]
MLPRCVHPVSAIDLEWSDPGRAVPSDGVAVAPSNTLPDSLAPASGAGGRTAVAAFHRGQSTGPRLGTQPETSAAALDDRIRPHAGGLVETSRDHLRGAWIRGAGHPDGAARASAGWTRPPGPIPESRQWQQRGGHACIQSP